MSQTVGPAGGTISLTGVGSLEIPPGALNVDTVITMSVPLTTPSPPPGYTITSPVAHFEPSGLTFNVPAILKLDVNQSIIGQNHPSLNHFVVINNSGKIELLKETVAPELATLNRGVLLPHFSDSMTIVRTVLTTFPLNGVCRTQLSFANDRPTPLNWDVANNAGGMTERQRFCPDTPIAGDGHFIVYYDKTGLVDNPATLKVIEGIRPDQESQIVGVVLALEKAFKHYSGFPKYSGYFGAALPVEWFFEGIPSNTDIPVLMLPLILADPNALPGSVGLVDGPDTGNSIPSDHYMVIEPRSNNLYHPALEETVYHEVAHLFQYMNTGLVERTIILPTPNPSNANLDHHMPLESTASYLGAKKFYDDWVEWNFSFQPRYTVMWDAKRAQHVFYPLDLLCNINEFLGKGIYEINTPGISYCQAGFMAYLSNTVGEMAMLNYPLYYFQYFNASVSNQDPLVGLANYLQSLSTPKKLHDEVFPDYAVHAFLRDRYGLTGDGSDSKTQTVTPFHVPGAYPSPVPSPVPVSIVSCDNSYSLLNQATSPGNPQNFGKYPNTPSGPPLISHITLEPMSIHYERILPDMSVIECMGTSSFPELVVYLDEVILDNGTVNASTEDFIGPMARLIPLDAAGEVVISDLAGRPIGIRSFGPTKQAVDGNPNQKYAVRIPYFRYSGIKSLIISVPNVTYGDSGTFAKQKLKYNFKAYINGSSTNFCTCGGLSNIVSARSTNSYYCNYSPLVVTPAKPTCDL